MENYIIEIFNNLINSDLKYYLMFIVGILEGMPIIGSFIPGGTISFLVGSQIPNGLFNPWLSFFILGFSNFLGDFIGFLIGRHSHKIKLIKKIVEKENLHTAWELFDKNLFYFVVIGRLIPVVRSLPSLLAGAKRVKIKRYLPLSLLGSLLWSFVGIFGGALVGQIFGKYAVGFIVIATFFVIAISSIKKYYKK